MANDDSRETDTPVRQDASTPADTSAPLDDTESIRAALETLERLTDAMLERLHDPSAEIGGKPRSQETHREARRRCREIRAETSQLGLLLYGPEATIPYRPGDSSEWPEIDE
ncbi:hypothetical protein [Natronobacterium gregoryi]|uniref:Uncharacterized protein n=2 Tax=Natronobacterium gregoryi TaxID=44930 RepID=L0AK25_NATGS|nr:hypothetical protein [Natronobacterium gregoryi]AFZ73410.1 hypothetical protein Natgr_2233 [Natronobacterium gregoryi SP2]ELY68606.1 hypothetical protein C490_09313 [Natronobacterium gregoryi SP2]PLK18498.1 hypothetical protein CYV19_17700 [Natronobacterium gregoryi SP2]SFI72751.1 hypothetical protein SAMN05443661_10493 [Natronobacterium gregoryi]